MTQNVLRALYKHIDGLPEEQKHYSGCTGGDGTDCQCGYFQVEREVHDALTTPQTSKNEIALALRKSDWSNVSIGNKAIIQAAILALDVPPPDKKWRDMADRAVRVLKRISAAHMNDCGDYWIEIADTLSDYAALKKQQP